MGRFRSLHPASKLSKNGYALLSLILSGLLLAPALLPSGSNTFGLNAAARNSEEPRTSPKRVLIVTTGLPGMWGSSSGIASMSERYISLFSKSGHHVSVLLPFHRFARFPSFRDLYAEKYNATVSLIDDLPETSLGSTHMRRSWAVLRFIEQNSAFDVIWFFDFAGLALYTTSAKDFHTSLMRTLVVVSSHGSTRLSRIGSGLPMTRTDLLLINMEDGTRAMADATTYPGQFFYDWTRKHFSLPMPLAENGIITPNFVGDGSLDAAPRQIAFPKVKFAFFGRLCHLKGLKLFLAAVKTLLSGAEMGTFEVLFIGSKVLEDGISTLEPIHDLARDVNADFQIFQNLTSADAISLMLNENIVAVLPSLADNQPLTLLECLSRGVPVIHSDTGDMKNMARLNSNMVTSGSLPSLIKAMRNVITAKQIETDSLRIDTRQAMKMTLEILDLPVKRNPIVPYSQVCRHVTVGIVTQGRSGQLLSHLEKLHDQDCSEFSLVVVNTGTDMNKTHLAELKDAMNKATMSASLIEMPGSTESEARYAILQTATTTHVLFLHDQSSPLPNLVSKLSLAALNSRAEVVTCFAASSNQAEAPVSVDGLPISMVSGIIGGDNFYKNTAGSTTALVQREFAIGLGEPTGQKSHGASWLFYQRLSLARAAGRIKVVPEPLYISEAGHDNTGDVLAASSSDGIAEDLCTRSNLSQTLCDILLLAKS